MILLCKIINKFLHNPLDESLFNFLIISFQVLFSNAFFLRYYTKTGKSKSNLPNFLSISKSRMIKLLPQYVITSAIFTFCIDLLYHTHAQQNYHFLSIYHTTSALRKIIRHELCHIPTLYH